jgi:alkylation response protein AidB-like acyl-CoA dehydrogenase/hydroxymethylpyrimidine pyrophosphatase-like HAD family hydrolase
VAIDLDGTILRSDGTISARTVAALARVGAAGARFVVATGRRPRHAMAVLGRFGYQGSVICANGALIYDTKDARVTVERLIPARRLAEAAARLRAAIPGLGIAVEYADSQVRDGVYEPGAWGSKEPVPRLRDAQLFGRDAVRILGRHPSLSADELLALAAPAAGQIVSVYHSGGLRLLEAVAAGVSKGTALAALAGRLGIAPRDVVAFGDMVNDLPMLAWAGTSYGVANAHPAVLAAVDHVTGGNDEDGVAAVIEQLFPEPLFPEPLFPEPLFPEPLFPSRADRRRGDRPRADALSSLPNQVLPTGAAVDFAETDEQRDLRTAVAAIARGFGPRYYAEHAAAREPCTELWSRLAGAGFIGVNLPEEYGGGGGGISELSIVGEEIAAQGTPLLLLVVSTAICGEVITAFGTEEQRKSWLPALAAGTSIMVFAITEPDAGSNTHRLSTTAVRDGDDWLINGTKYYTSGVDEADNLMVVARTGHDDKGRASLSLFVVPTGAQGLQARVLPVDVMLPERQFTLHFDDVRVGPGALVGAEGDGFRQVFHGLNPERIMGAAAAVGVARYVLGAAARYASQRQVWQVPIGAHQGVAHPLAKAKIETELAALMTRQAAWQHDHDLPAGEASNMAKYAAAEAAIAAVDAAVQAHGGNGLSTEYGLMPYLGMARLTRIAPVNREMILNYVAQHSLGLPRSY